MSACLRYSVTRLVYSYKRDWADRPAFPPTKHPDPSALRLNNRRADCIRSSASSAMALLRLSSASSRPGHRQQHPGEPGEHELQRIHRRAPVRRFVPDAKRRDIAGLARIPKILDDGGDIPHRREQPPEESSLAERSDPHPRCPRPPDHRGCPNVAPARAARGCPPRPLCNGSCRPVPGRRSSHG